MKKIILAAFMLSITLTACTHQTGDVAINQVENYTAVKDGVSTAKEVYNIFLQPHAVYDEDPECVIWEYYANTTDDNIATAVAVDILIPFGGLLIPSKNSFTRFSVLFDTEGVVQKSLRKKAQTHSFLLTGVGNVFGVEKNVRRVEKQMETHGLPYDRSLAIEHNVEVGKLKINQPIYKCDGTFNEVKKPTKK